MCRYAGGCIRTRYRLFDARRLGRASRSGRCRGRHPTYAVRVVVASPAGSEQCLGGSVALQSTLCERRRTLASRHRCPFCVINIVFVTCVCVSGIVIYGGIVGLNLVNRGAHAARRIKDEQNIGRRAAG